MRVDVDATAVRFQHSVRALIARRDDPQTSDQRLWQDLAEHLCLAVTLPVSRGGLELGEAAAVLVCEELGRGLVVMPYADALLAIDCLASRCETGRHAETLVALSRGRARVCAIDMLEGGPGTLTPTPTNGGWRLDGISRPVHLRPPVDALLVAATAEGRRIVCWIPSDRSGWRLTRHGRETHPDAGVIAFEGLSLVPGDVLITADDPRLEGEIVPRAHLRHAALLLGLCIGAQRRTSRYARRRLVGGRPLIELPTVSLGLAAVRAEIEAARLLVRWTAWLADHHHALGWRALESLATCSELALGTTRRAVQWHGAFGLTLRSRIHAYYLRAMFEALRAGPPAGLWARVGAMRLAGETAASRDGVRGLRSAGGKDDAKAGGGG